MPPKINLVGQKFGQLTVLEEAKRDKFKKIFWKCKCNCGNEIIVNGSSLRRGVTQSCGCLQKKRTKENNTKHGQNTCKEGRTLAYNSWANMIGRCYYPNRPDYCYYGGRGIKVCKRWHKFENFYTDMGDRPKEKTLDRKNNNKNYSPRNCRWATVQEQLQNRRISRENRK